MEYIKLPKGQKRAIFGRLAERPPAAGAIAARCFIKCILWRYMYRMAALADKRTFVFRHREVIQEIKSLRNA